VNEYVSNNTCVACAPGTTNAALDDASGSDTTCDVTYCAVNEFVSNHVCVACAPGTTNAAGDDASGSNTTCDCRIRSRLDLDIHLDDYFSNTITDHICSDISTWDVSNVTDYSELFLDRADFNANISNWNTSSVTDL